MITINSQDFTVELPSGAIVRPIDGEITMDELWAPFIQGSVTISTPASLTGLDPRTTPIPRIKVKVQQDFTDSDEVSVFTTAFAASNVAALTTAYGAGTVAAITAARNRPWASGETRRRRIRIFDLSLRSRTKTSENTLILGLASDEAYLQDIASLVSPTTSAIVPPFPWITDNGTVPGVLSDAVTAVLQPLGMATSDPLIVRVDRGLSEYVEGPFFPSGSGVPWPAGVTAWELLAPLVEVAGARLWVDESRVWHLDAPQGDNDTTITVAATGNLTQSADEISRQTDWYDSVVINYTWTKANGSTGVSSDFARTGTIPGFTYSRTYIVNRDLGLRSNSFTPPVGAAATLHSQMVTRGRVVNPTAVSDYAAIPGASVTLNLPDGSNATGRISSVRWDFASREMSLTTRNIS